MPVTIGRASRRGAPRAPSTPRIVATDTDPDATAQLQPGRFCQGRYTTASTNPVCAAQVTATATSRGPSRAAIRTQPTARRHARAAIAGTGQGALGTATGDRGSSSFIPKGSTEASVLPSTATARRRACLLYTSDAAN